MPDLACPSCGSPDSLYTAERTTMLYPVWAKEGDPNASPHSVDVVFSENRWATYSGHERIDLSDESEFDGTLVCRNCGTFDIGPGELQVLAALPKEGP